MRTKFLVLAALVVGTSACGSSDNSPSAVAADASEPATELTVFAASSLTNAFTAIGKDFESATPGTTVNFNFGMDPDMSTVGIRAFMTTSNGMTIAEASAMPAIEKQLSRDQEILAERCGIANLEIKIDWNSFRGHWKRTPEEVTSLWEGMRGGLNVACRQNKAFFSRIKTFELKFDGSLERGNIVKGGAQKYEVVGSVLRLNVNHEAGVANMEETAYKWVEAH